MRTLVALLLAAAFAAAADPVITLDYTGGYTPPRLSKEPYLAIYEDGTVRACNPFRKDKPREDKMTKEAVAKLVKELAPKVVELKKLPGDTPPIVDASTTVIRVGKKTAKQYALGYVAEQHPKNETLRALRSAQLTLDRIYNVTMAGGAKKADSLLAEANKLLKKEWPKSKPFTLDELGLSGANPRFRKQDGKRWVVVTFVDGKASIESGGGAD